MNGWVLGNVILYLFKFVSSHYHYPTCGMMLIQGMISDEMRARFSKGFGGDNNLRFVISLSPWTANC